VVSHSSTPGYAGDLRPKEAWELLKREPDAQLVDVRTSPEWAFVGLPDLSSLNREVHKVEWQRYPSMQLNPDFVAEVGQALARVGAQGEGSLLFLCRSGARSRAAAMTMSQAGCARAYNVSEGFEGDLDAGQHRGTENGWKAAGLPWRQS